MRAIRPALLLVFCLLLLASCESLKSMGSSEDSATPEGMATSTFDFGDIPIPTDMELDQAKSNTFQAGDIKAGVLVFSGRIERLSLANYFIGVMPQQGWVLRSAFKGPRTILFFEKPNKFCMMSITDGTIKTALEVWMAPTSPSSGSGDSSYSSPSLGGSGGQTQQGPTLLEPPMKEKGLQQ